MTLFAKRDAARALEKATRPIIFSGDSVLGILEKRKTQTRRVMRLQPDDVGAISGQPFICRQVNGNWTRVNVRAQYLVGSRWYVKEALWRDSREKGSAYEAVIYQATPELWKQKDKSDKVQRVGFPTTDRDGVRPTRDESERNLVASNFWARQSPILCPRWASRITLQVLEIRAERLQDISEADAKAEGVEAAFPPGVGPATHLCGYLRVWHELNGKTHPWASNPWVWVYTFARLNDGQTAPPA